jgi:penicillin-binding protein 1C
MSDAPAPPPRAPRLRTLLLAAGAATALLLAAAAALSGLNDPAPTILLLDRQGEFLGEIGAPGSEDLGFWRLKSIPPRVAAATIAIEDRRFGRHLGVDPLALLRAAWDNLRLGRRSSGASTLAMQVARMQRPGARTLWRKGVEALAALGLTARNGRDGVLAHYLRLAPYGNRIHGIGYAARRYLGKPVEDLSWAEVAFLTALPQAPGRMNPYLPAGRARASARARRILAQLRDAGALSPAEHELALRQIDGIVVPRLPRRPEEALHPILKIAAAYADPAARRALPDPPLVRSTLDLGLQQEVARLTAATVRALADDGARNAAAILLDRASGDVLAWVGSAGYYNARDAGAIDYAGVPRPAGSTLKPFLYALALERGLITPATVLDDSARGPGGVEDADLEFLGPLLPRFALANSRNVPAVRLLERVGLEATWTLYRDLGLHDGTRPARFYGTGLALGVLPVSLAGLVRAGTALANDGLLVEPRLIPLPGAPAPRRLLAESAARQISLFLSDPMARLPGFARMGANEYPFPAAVKTGTSAGCRDAWTLAWSSRAVVGVWVGRPDFRPMRSLGGYRAAAALARRILSLRHADQLDGMSDRPFPPPRGYVPVRLCAATGLLPGPACDRVVAEWFAPGQEPQDTCDHRSTPGLLAHRGPLQLRGARATRLRVSAPEAGAVLLADPEMPPGSATIALQAEADPPAPELTWYVDGRPWRIAGYPYTVRWPIAPGAHTFQVRIPGQQDASAPIRVSVH